MPCDFCCATQRLHTKMSGDTQGNRAREKSRNKKIRYIYIVYVYSKKLWSAHSHTHTQTRRSWWRWVFGACKEGHTPKKNNYIVVDCGAEIIMGNIYIIYTSRGPPHRKVEFTITSNIRLVIILLHCVDSIDKSVCTFMKTELINDHFWIRFYVYFMKLWFNFKLGAGNCL